MKVVGVDAGYVNFAVCCVDSKDVRRPIYWKNDALFTGTFSEEKLARAVYAWIKREDIKALLDGADVIVLERQMQKKFQAINHCIRFNYFDKTVEVNPSTLGKDFKLPQDRKSKKKAAVDIVGNNCVFPVKKGKKDDLADAYLLAVHKIFDSHPELRKGFREEHGQPSRSKKQRVKTKAVKLQPGSGGHYQNPTPTAASSILASYGQPAWLLQ